MPAPLSCLLRLLFATLTLLAGAGTVAAQAAPSSQDPEPTADPAPRLPLVQLPAPADRARPRGVVGRCMRGGHSIGGIEVALHTTTSDAREIARIAADATGRFRLPLPPPGDYDLRLSGDAVSKHQTPFRMRLRDGGDALLGDLELRNLIRIRGVVIAPAGSPAGGARITFRQPGAEPVSTTADAEGRFAVDDVAIGAATITAVATEADGGIQISVTSDDNACEVRLRRVLRARARFVDDEDKPLAVDVQIIDGKNATPKVQAIASGKACDFTLHEGATVRLLAAGCTAQEFAAATFCNLDRVELTRNFALRGDVVGASATAVVHLEAGHRASSRQLELAGDRLDRDLPVANDGVFACPELPRGSYRLTLRDGDRGASPAIEIDVPTTVPVRLELRPGRPVAVRVLDERGEPMPYAVARREDDKTAWPCDRNGIAVVACPDAPCTVVVDGHGYLPAAATIARSATAADVRARRAAVIAGRVADIGDLTRCELRVLAWQRGREASPVAIPIAEDGSFRSDDLEAGNWQLALERRDRTRIGGKARRRSDVPVIAAGIDPRTTIAVAANSGVNADIVVPAPRIAALAGTVTIAGKPAANVVVFASARGDDGRTRTNPLGFDAPLAHAGLPHAITDADGRFEMLVARTGRYEVRARHPSQPTASAPTEITVVTCDQDLELPLTLPAATVRGRWPDGATAPDAFAMLVPAKDAAAANGDAESGGRLRLRLGKNGEFAFAAVAPGDYVLRLSRGGRVVAQQPVQVAGAAVDVGTVTPPPQPR